jgi:hypothetical protein
MATFRRFHATRKNRQARAREQRDARLRLNCQKSSLLTITSYRLPQRSFICAKFKNLLVITYLPFMKPPTKFISKSVFILYDADSDVQAAINSNNEYDADMYLVGIGDIE